MTFCLDTVIIPPENDEPIKNAVILLHGYGGDGKDISMLTLNWKRFLKIQFFCVQMDMKNVKLIHRVFNGLIYQKMMKNIF